MCICTYMYVHVNIICIHTRIYSYINIYIHTHVFIFSFMYMYMAISVSDLDRQTSDESVCTQSHACGDCRPRLPMNDPLFLNAVPRPLSSDGDNIGAAIGGKEPGIIPLCKPNVCTYMPNKQKNAFECSYVSMLIWGSSRGGIRGKFLFHYASKLATVTHGLWSGRSRGASLIGSRRVSGGSIAPTRAWPARTAGNIT